jgi:hypothetical protein
VRQGAGDDPAGLAACFRFGSIGFRGGFGKPQTDTEVDEGAAQRGVLPSRLILPSRRFPADSYCIGDSPDAR